MMFRARKTFVFIKQNTECLGTSTRAPFKAEVSDRMTTSGGGDEGTRGIQSPTVAADPCFMNSTTHLRPARGGEAVPRKPASRCLSTKRFPYLLCPAPTRAQDGEAVLQLICTPRGEPLRLTWEMGPYSREAGSLTLGTDQTVA